METDLVEDISKLHKEANFDTLRENLSFKEPTEEWLDNTYDKEHLTALMIMLKDAHDMSEKAKRIHELKGEEVHVHHIFPKSFLKNALNRGG